MKEILINNYTKKIKNNTVLYNINYKFLSGKIYGLYGRNGSGKTMLLHAIAGLILPTDGQVIIDNKILHKDMDFPEEMGIIIEHTDLLPQFDAYTNLEILSNIKKVATKNDIISAIESVGLNSSDKKKVRQYSLGMRQKLSIAQAVFEKPKLLILDEPTNGLDNESINDIRDMLLSFSNKNTIIIIASHNNEDLRVLCNEIIKMENGELIEKEGE